MPYELKLFSGNAHRALAEEIAACLGMPLGQAEVTRFSDGEVFVQIDENVRGADVFVVQPTCPPGERQPDGAPDHARRRQARLGRAHHRGAPVLRLRAPGPEGAAARADHGQARGRPDHRGGRRARPRDRPPRRPDPGLLQHPGRPPLRGPGPPRLPRPARPRPTWSSSRRTPAASSARGRSPSGSAPGLAIIDKRRDGPNVAEVMHIIGDVKGQDAIIIDDMIDTAGTLVQAADALKREGARRILACGVHPVLSGPAMARIEGAPLEEVVVTNTIPLGKDKQLPRSRFSRSRRSSRRRSGASTTRNRCPPCSCRRRPRQGDGRP